MWFASPVAATPSSQCETCTNSRAWSLAATLCYALRCSMLARTDSTFCDLRIAWLSTLTVAMWHGHTADPSIIHTDAGFCICRILLVH